MFMCIQKHLNVVQAKIHTNRSSYVPKKTLVMEHLVSCLAFDPWLSDITLRHQVSLNKMRKLMFFDH